MVNTTYNSSEDMIFNKQSLKRRRKLNFYKNLSTCYDEMNNRNFKFEEDPLSKNAQGNNKVCHEVLLLMKILQTRPEGKNLNKFHYDLYFTVIKNRGDKEIVKNKCEDNENDFKNYVDFITPNYYIGRENDNILLK